MSYKILVIDHDPDNFEGMMRPLIGAGYEVVLATDADQGLDTFERMHPDLTMIEAFLPQRTGLQLCRQLRQTETGQSTPIVLIHDAERGEDARKSLDGCDCNQIIDRPVSDELLLEVCQRLLPAEDARHAPDADSSETGDDPESTASVESPDAAQVDPDTFLNNEQLGDALGRLNLIIDGEAEKPDHEKVVGVAEQRGDFSYIADELKAVGDSPVVSEGRDELVVAAREEPMPAAVTKPSPPPSATTPPDAGLRETMASDDLGDDISAHLDTLFGGGEPSSPAADEGVADVEAAADVPAPAETSAPSAVTAEAARESVPEPSVETATAPAPVAARPAPPRVAQSQTEAAVPPQARKTVPTAAMAVPHESTAGRSKLWLVAASVAVVIIGGASALFFMRGSSPDPLAAIPDAPAQTSSDSQTLASVGVPRREAAPALPVTLPQQSDASGPQNSLVDPGASSPAVPTEPKPDQPPATQTSPKPQKAPAVVAKPDPPKPKRTTRATPKATPRVNTPPAEPKPAAPKPAPVEVAAARTTPRSESQPRTPGPKPAEPTVQPRPATTAGTVIPTAADAEKTTPPPNPSPERVEPVTETARLTPRSEPTRQPAIAAPTPEPAAAPPTADPVFLPPVVIERVEPVYSRKARKKDEKGTIVINVLVAENGSIARVVVDRGMPGSELEAAAMNAVVRWKFKPATDGGKPVKAWTKAQFVFD